MKYLVRILPVGICRWSVGTGPDEPELRRLKSIAASRGVSVQQAMQGAIEMWTSRPPESRAEPLEGSFAGVDVHALMRRERGDRVGPGPALEPECPDRFLIPRPDGLVKLNRLLGAARAF